MQTAELIQFPVPDTAELKPFYYIMEGEAEIFCMTNLTNARNVARLFALDWPNEVFTVVDEWNNVLFTTGQEVN